MYIGHELVWHKIKREGYYSIIVKTAHRSMIVLIFDEKKGEFEVIRSIENKTESPAYYAELMVTADSERIYVSTLGIESLIAASIDGINWGNTNLEYDEVVVNNPVSNMFPSSSYCADYMWRVNHVGSGSSDYIIKNRVSFENGNYSVRNTSTRIGASGARAFGEDSKIAISPRDSGGIFAFDSYDTEEESFWKICELDSALVSRWRYYKAHEMYILLVDIRENTSLNSHCKRYAYFSTDGKNFERSLIEETKPRQNSSSEYFENDIPAFILYREGIYYMYCGAGSYDTRDTDRIILTSDFRHLSTKKIKNYITIGGKTFGTITNSYQYGSTLKPLRRSSDNSIRYFYDGDRAVPEDGMILVDDEYHPNDIAYIDNMFFRESSGNRVFHLEQEY